MTDTGVPELSDASLALIAEGEGEARRLSHGYFGTEHVLLGALVIKPESIERVLESQDVTLDRARDLVQRMAGRGDEPSPKQLPRTPRASRLVELASVAATRSDVGLVDPCHLLLAILFDRDCSAHRVLAGCEADLETMRRELVKFNSM